MLTAMKETTQIVVIGGGLCGSLLALRLAQRGYKVDVYEGRPDLRTTDISAGRSINLALSDRGLKALRLAGVEEKVRKICIPMKGRLMHDVEGNTFESRYSGREGEYINSISRGDLNGILLTEAEKHENVNMYFNQRCIHVDIEKKTATFESYESKEQYKVSADVIFGTDGAGSALRKSYEEQFPDFKVSQEFLTHGYKELEIPGIKGKHQISKDHLHIWPRGSYMLIALPNMDGSFTVTLFLSYSEGEFHFENLTSKEKIIEFFKRDFPDSLELIPDILHEFETNPTGKLGTVKCNPWAYKGNTLLMGDAAHAIVPFYGQGMNASFEDVAELDAVIDTHEKLGKLNWSMVFDEFQKERKKNADAIADLAIDNYYEMRDHVANESFIKKRRIEMALERNFPSQYASKYSLVTFNEHIGYYQAMTQGRIQDQVLLSMIEKDEVNEDSSLEDVLKKVLEETAKRMMS